MGLKEYNEAMFASKTGSSSKNKRRRKFERLNKHRPKEISSKVRVPKMRQVVKVTKKLTKDPRFDNSCGEFDEKVDYQFNNHLCITFIKDNMFHRSGIRSMGLSGTYKKRRLKK